MEPTGRYPFFQLICWGPEGRERVPHLRSFMRLFPQPILPRVNCSSRACTSKAQGQPRGGSLQGEGLEHKHVGGVYLMCMQDPLWCGPESWLRRRKEGVGGGQGLSLPAQPYCGTEFQGCESLQFKPGLSGVCEDMIFKV